MEIYTHDLMKAFSLAAAKDDGRATMDFVEAILEERPDLRGIPVLVPKQGVMGHLVIIGSEVFKGPINAAPDSVARRVYDTEVETLLQLRESAQPLKYAKINYIGQKSLFFCMDLIPGVPLYTMPNLSKRQKRALADDIATFMIGMARAMPGLTPGKYAYHFDINGGNILINPRTKKLTGIIDFGDVVHNVPMEYFHASIGRGLHDLPLDKGINDLVKARLEARRGELETVPVAAQPRKINQLRR